MKLHIFEWMHLLKENNEQYSSILTIFCVFVNKPWLKTNIPFKLSITKKHDSRAVYWYFELPPIKKMIIDLEKMNSTWKRLSIASTIYVEELIKWLELEELKMLVLDQRIWDISVSIKVITQQSRIMPIGRDMICNLYRLSIMVL